MAVNLGSIKAFFSLDPTPAVKGMKTATRVVKKGTKEINTSLRTVKRLARTAFVGWGVTALGKDFVQAAMDMDSMRKSMAAAVGGMEKGRREINFLRMESQKMGLSFKDSTRDFKQLAAAAKGTALEGEGIRKVWKSLQNATVALQLSVAETSGTVFAFKDMLSKGTVMAEELKRQLGNRLPGAFRMAANAMGMTTKELAKQMKLGNIMADEFLPNLAREMDKTYAGAAVEASKAMRAEMNKARSAWFDFQATFMEVSGASEALAKSLRTATKAINDMTQALRGGAEISKWFIDMGVSVEVFGTKVSGVFEKFTSLMRRSTKTPEIIAADRLISEASTKESMAKIKAHFAVIGVVLADEKKKLAKELFQLTPVGAVLSKMFPSKENEGLSGETRKFIQQRKAQLKQELKLIKKSKEDALEAAGLTEVAKKLDNEMLAITKKTQDSITKIKADAEKLKKSLKETRDSTKDMPVPELGDPKIVLSKWDIAFQDLEVSLAKFGKTSTDIGKNIQKGFTSAFRGIENALAQMVTKGKVDWRSLADSMISDMVRIAARQAITGPLAMAMSAGMASLSGIFGPASASSSAGFVNTPVATSVPSHVDLPFANGGMINETVLGTGQRSGKSYSFAENGSEAVLNKNQIKNLGSNKQSIVSVKPQINISTPAGTQATTQTSSDGMNIDVLITAIESKLSSNMRRGGGLADTMQQTFGLNRAAGANR